MHILVAVVLYLFVAQAQANVIVSIYDDRGGQMINYALRVARLAESGTYVRLLGRCASACTLYLSLPKDQYCVGQNVSLRFHAPYGQGSGVAATRYLFNKYPDWVQTWIARRGGLSTRVLIMRYNYARLFAAICPKI